MNKLIDTLEELKEKIATKIDKKLFTEAVKAAQCGALRASYIMLWLSCCESIKRRFKEVGAKDSNVGKITTEIASKESKHESIDLFLLKEACKYGFIDTAEQTLLMQTYQLRCLFAHPYEKAPTSIQIEAAAETIVHSILSKPVLMGRGYACNELDNLIEKQHYLIDEQSVNNYAISFMKKISRDALKWFIEKYAQKIHDIILNSMAGNIPIIERSIWFCKALINNSENEIFSNPDWHKQINSFPEFYARLIPNASIYKEIGNDAQSSLLNFLLTESKKNVECLLFLEKLHIEGSLDKDAEEKFYSSVLEKSQDKIYQSKLSISTLYRRIMCDFCSGDFHQQNYAIEYINKSKYIQKLTKDKQCEIGKSILKMAGTRGSRSFCSYAAYDYMNNIEHNSNCTHYMLLGMLNYMLFDDKNDIRLNVSFISCVLRKIETIIADHKELIASEIINLLKLREISSSVSLYRLDEFEELNLQFNEHIWAAKWKTIMNQKLENFKMQSNQNFLTTDERG